MFVTYIINMKLLLLAFLFSFSTLYSQELHHQMLSSQGTSKELSNGIYVSQTIGQQSVIGNYTKDGKTYGQGYQQSVWSKYDGLVTAGCINLEMVKLYIKPQTIPGLVML